MIEPRYSWFWDRFWPWHLRRIIAKDFHSFEYGPKIPIEPDRGLLLVANHFSWWDGFFAYRLNDLLFKKRFHVMVLEESLISFPVLRTLGGFSVKKRSRSVIESLRFAASLLDDPGNLVLMFPQGDIQSVYVERPSFKTGVCRIIRATRSPIQVVLAVVLVDYASKRRPMVRIYLKEYPPADDLEEDLKAAFLGHYEEAKALHAGRLYEPFPY